MTKDQRPPVLNSQMLNVLVKPAGPHHRAKRFGSLNAAKTCSTVAGISREVLKVIIVFLHLGLWVRDGGHLFDEQPLVVRTIDHDHRPAGATPECSRRHAVAFLSRAGEITCRRFLSAKPLLMLS